MTRCFVFRAGSVNENASPVKGKVHCRATLDGLEKTDRK